MSTIIPAHLEQEARVRHASKKKLRHTHSAVTYSEAEAKVNRLSFKGYAIKKNTHGNKQKKLHSVEHLTSLVRETNAMMVKKEIAFMDKSTIQRHFTGQQRKDMLMLRKCCFRMVPT